jgi:glycosyltransferase involved in cell wall biosynthesis
VGRAGESSGGPAAREPLLSVVICTVDRAGLLKGALESLADQTAPPQSFGVIVVDNGSTDATREVAEEFGQVLTLRYVREERMGLSHARNRAWAEARGDYVAYLDDDARARPEWVANLCAAIEEEAPEVLGGPVVPVCTTSPDWFPLDSQGWSLGGQRRLLGRHEHVRGENFAVARALLERLGGFRPDLGMAGGALGYGEETELQERLRREQPGARVLYCPGVVVEHLVRPEKMTLRWQFRRAWRQGWQAAHIYDARAFSSSRWPRLHALALACGHLPLAALLLASCPLRSRRRSPYWRTYVMLRVLPHVYSFCAHASFVLARRRSEGG